MNHKQVITQWPSVDALASDLGVLPSRVIQWRTRNSIPAEFYSGVLDSARKRGINLDAETLANGRRAA